MLPVTPQSELAIVPISWLGLPHTYQNEGEMEILVALARSIKARSMLEIGCNTGRTAALMLFNVPTLERYQGVDVPPDHMPTLSSQRFEVPAIAGEHAVSDPRFDLIIRPRGSFDIRAEELCECDVCYVDGDHSEEAVRNDTWLALDRTRPDGIIVWHDYQSMIGVRTVVDELYDGGFPIRLIERTWFAYLRKETS